MRKDRWPQPLPPGYTCPTIDRLLVLGRGLEPEARAKHGALLESLRADNKQLRRAYVELHRAWRRQR